MLWAKLVPYIYCRFFIYPQGKKRVTRKSGWELISLKQSYVFVYFLPRNTHSTHHYQPLVPGEDDGVEHGFIEEAVAHPLRYYDVNLLDRKLHLLHLAFEDGDHCNTQDYNLRNDNA